MSNGTTVTGPAGLKKVILERKDEFVEVMAAKLLTYALGRGLEYYDQPAVRGGAVLPAGQQCDHSRRQGLSIGARRHQLVCDLLQSGDQAFLCDGGGGLQHLPEDLQGEPGL